MCCLANAVLARCREQVLLRVGWQVLSSACHYPIWAVHQSITLQCRVAIWHACSCGGHNGWANNASAARTWRPGLPCPVCSACTSPAGLARCYVLRRTALLLSSWGIGQRLGVLMDAMRAHLHVLVAGGRRPRCCHQWLSGSKVRGVGVVSLACSVAAETVHACIPSMCRE